MTYTKHFAVWDEYKKPRTSSRGFPNQGDLCMTFQFDKFHKITLTNFQAAAGDGSQSTIHCVEVPGIQVLIYFRIVWISVRGQLPVLGLVENFFCNRWLVGNEHALFFQFCIWQSGAGLWDLASSIWAFRVAGTAGAHARWRTRFAWFTILGRSASLQRCGGTARLCSHAVICWLALDFSVFGFLTKWKALHWISKFRSCSGFLDSRQSRKNACLHCFLLIRKIFCREGNNHPVSEGGDFAPPGFYLHICPGTPT